MFELCIHEVIGFPNTNPTSLRIYAFYRIIQERSKSIRILNAHFLFELKKLGRIITNTKPCVQTCTKYV